MSLLQAIVKKQIQHVEAQSTATFKVETTTYPIEGVLKDQDERFWYTEVLMDKGNGEVARCKWDRTRFHR